MHHVKKPYPGVGARLGREATVSLYLPEKYRLIGLVALTVYLVLSALSTPVQGQVAVGQQDALAAAIPPLNAITPPDINVLGLLDQEGPGADHAAWGDPITVPGKRLRLQQLGKAWFWDMQVGGDGIQACASCHFHAGADNRKVNQMSPGLKRTVGNEEPATSFDKDTDHDLLAVPGGGATVLGPNGTLTVGHFSHNSDISGEPVGLPVSEQALIDANGGDGVGDVLLADLPVGSPIGPPGTPGLATGVGAILKATDPNADVNDVVSSQGVRLHTHDGITCLDTDVTPAVKVGCDDPDADTTDRTDTATLVDDDPGFNTTFTHFTTSRRVEPRNSPTVLNSIFHLRNFWDGRADAFFNGVTPLGFRDQGMSPDRVPEVKVYNASLSTEKLRLPFSSLASQAVGPIESDFEMVFSGRLHHELGKKLLAPGVVPLNGQFIATDDSLLGTLRDGSGRGLAIPANSYDGMIREIFDERFWGDGSQNDVCLNANGDFVDTGTCTTPDGYRLIEWNFALFFGLAVQAYEALLITEQTPVDLLVGGIAKGQVINTRTRRNGNIAQQAIVPVTNLPLEGCILLASLGNSAAEQAVATELCIQHYAQFMHPLATAGSQANTATGGLVNAGDPIGGCETLPLDLETVVTEAQNGVVTPFCDVVDIAASTASLQAIDRGLGRFFAGATGCGICHFNPEFTGATVSALTGFGAAPLPPLPPGQLNRIPPEKPMERMIAFNGAAMVYDSGFYNLGVRPTPEDLSIGDQIGGVPLAYTKLAELIAAGPTLDPPFDALYDEDKIAAIADELLVDPVSGLNELLIPISPTDLRPRPFLLDVACGPGLVGNAGGNGNGAGGPNAGDGGEPANNPIPQCDPTVIPNERLLRHGAFKASDIRMTKATGPFFHNGSKMTLEHVVNFYETAGSFSRLNLENLDAGMRIFQLGDTDTAALIEMIETGLTDWRVMHEEGIFDHPELCVPNGHDPDSGRTILASIPAVGTLGATNPLATFEEVINNVTSETHEHSLTEPCEMPGIQTTVVDVSLSNIDMQHPVPTVTLLSPTSATAGDSSFLLTVTGTGFVSTSAIRWGTTPKTTTVVSDTELTATIDAADIASPGSIDVTVANPPPAGGLSNAVTFTIDPS